MNSTLKAAGHIGAELGAAKAENARLRGLLTQALEFTEANTCGGPDVAQLIAEMRAALSQQSEPTDTYTAVDMATAAAQGFRDGQKAEPAPAQDEQQPIPEGWLIEMGFDVLDKPFRFVDSKSHTPTVKVILPACEPEDSSSWDLRDEIARRISSLLAAPIAQTDQRGDA